MQFWRGFVAALVALEVLGLLALRIWIAPGLAAMYQDFATTVRMPAIYDLAASSVWQLGVLFGLTAMAVGVGRGLADRRASLVGLVVVALGGAALVGLTVWGLYAPTFALAGQIR